MKALVSGKTSHGRFLCVYAIKVYVFLNEPHHTPVFVSIVYTYYILLGIPIGITYFWLTFVFIDFNNCWIFESFRIVCCDDFKLLLRIGYFYDYWIQIYIHPAKNMLSRTNDGSHGCSCHGIKPQVLFSPFNSPNHSHVPHLVSSSTLYTRANQNEWTTKLYYVTKSL